MNYHNAFLILLSQLFSLKIYHFLLIIKTNTYLKKYIFTNKEILSFTCFSHLIDEWCANCNMRTL